MKTLRLVRISEYQGATLGVLCIDGKPELVTLEDAWLNNERTVSCIPDGIYRVTKINSPKFGVTYTVNHVKDRDFIRFHWGNDTGDTEGCIIVGLKYGISSLPPTVVQSQLAFKRFMNLMGGEAEAELIVISAYGHGSAH